MSNDDEFEASITQRVTSGSDATARKEALKRQMEKKGLGNDAINKADAAKGKLQLNILKHQMEGMKDDQTKKDQENAAKVNAAKSFGPKTRMQEEKAQQLTADTQMTADKSAKQEAADKKGAQELQKTDVSTEGG